MTNYLEPPQVVVWCPLSERVGTIEFEQSVLALFPCSARFSLGSYSCFRQKTKDIVHIVPYKLVKLTLLFSRLLAGRITVLIQSLVGVVFLFAKVDFKKDIVFVTCLFPLPVIFVATLLSRLFPSNSYPVINCIQGTPSFLRPSIPSSFLNWRKFENKLRKFSFLHFYSYSSAIVCSSKKLTIQLAELGLSSLYTIPNGILDSHLGVQLKSNIETLLSNYNNGRLSFVFVGRITHQKNVIGLINAFSLFSCSYLGSVSLTFIGNGDLLESLKGKYKSSSQIRFLGYKDNPWLLVQPHDIVICPSFWEEPGHVPLEAFNAGYLCFVSSGCTVIDSLPESLRKHIAFSPYEVDTLFDSLPGRLQYILDYLACANNPTVFLKYYTREYFHSSFVALVKKIYSQHG